jgi:phage-related protein
MRVRYSLLAAVAIPMALSLATPASAGLFDSIGNTVKGAEKSVEHAASGVVKKVDKAATGAVKGVEHAAGSVVNKVEHTAGDAVHTVGGVVKKVGPGIGAVEREIVKDGGKVINTTGTVVSKYYDKAGDVVGYIPVLKEFKGPAKDVSKCAATREGKIGGTIGATVGVVTGGVGSLALAVGEGGLQGCLAKKGYDGAKKAADAVKNEVRSDVRDVRKSWREGLQ